MFREETIQIPALFNGRKEYKNVSSALEKAQGTFNEELLYQALTNFAMGWYRNTGRPARVLDLCSATGLAAVRVARSIPVAEVTLVDKDHEVLKAGSAYFADSGVASTHCTDAVTFRSTTKYDLILMNSAYHHIENERKVSFLKNAKTLLAPSGQILIGEHFLAPYSNPSEFRQRVVEFYSILIDELTRRGEPEEAIAVIRQSAYYCWLGEYEYKVSWDIFISHLSRVNLIADDVSRVWPSRQTFQGEIGSSGIVLTPP